MVEGTCLLLVSEAGHLFVAGPHVHGAVHLVPVPVHLQHEAPGLYHRVWRYPSREREAPLQLRRQPADRGQVPDLDAQHHGHQPPADRRVPENLAYRPRNKPSHPLPGPEDVLHRERCGVAAEGRLFEECCLWKVYCGGWFACKLGNGILPCSL